MKVIFFKMLFVIIIVVSVGLVFYFMLQKNTLKKTVPNEVNSVCINRNCFNVELAKTNAEREKGLMYRTQLDKDKGMIFVFDNEGIYPFWMKSTLIPLDIIWINGNNKVVFIGQNVQPCKSLICMPVIPSSKAKYVLEINAGQSKDFVIKVGDSVIIK